MYKSFIVATFALLLSFATFPNEITSSKISINESFTTNQEVILGNSNQGKNNDQSKTTLSKEQMASVIAETKAEIKKELMADKTFVDDIKKDIVAENGLQFQQEELAKAQAENVERNVLVEVLTPIRVGGKIHIAGEKVKVSEEEAVQFCKPLEGSLDGWGQGDYHKTKIVRARRVDNRQAIA